MNQTIFVQLQKVLAELYTDGSSIRRIVDNAGLDTGRITFTASAINTWHSVLVEADKVHRVEDLLAIVAEEYGKNQGFRAAYRAYRQANGKSGRVDSVPEVPVKPVRSWLPAMIVLLLIGMVGNGLYWSIPDLRNLGSNVPTVTPTLADVATHEGQLTVVPAATTTLSTNSAPTTPTQALAVSTTSIPELPTSTSTVTLTSTPISSPTPQSTAAAMPTPTPGYPCEAKTTSKSNVNSIRLLIGPAGRIREETIPTGVTVQILKRRKEGLVEIWYDKDQVGGWVYDENLVLSDLCPQ